MNNYQFCDLQIGMKEQFEADISQEMMDRFRDSTGDINPLHCDETFAKERGYATNVCYGMLTASFLSTLAGVYLPGRNCLIQSVEVKFAKPVYVGDHLIIEGVVKELNDTVEQAVLKVTIRNQSDEKVLRGIMKVGVLHER